MNSSAFVWRRYGALAWKSSAPVLALCLLVSVAHAQGDGKEANLPDSIRLTLRGKPGDVVTYKATESTNEVANVSLINFQYTVDVNAEYNWTWKLRGTGPNGVLLIEVRNPGGTAMTEVSTGQSGATQQNTIKFPAGAGLFTLTPLQEMRSLTSLRGTASAPSRASAKSGSKRTGTKQSSVVRPTTETLSIVKGTYNPIPFPNKVLQVGDTWQGTLPENHFNGADISLPKMPFTASLESIEMFQNVPCAKVEYTITFQGRIPALDALMVKGAPAGTKASGIVEISGKRTAYYTLDRGLLLDQDDNLRFQFMHKVTTPNPSGGKPITVDAEGSVNSELHHTATQFPTYDASLLTPVASPVPACDRAGDKPEGGK